MATLTLELDDEQEARLAAVVAAWQASVPDVVMAGVEMLAQSLAENDVPLTSEEEEAIREGLADAAAGRVIDHETVLQRALQIAESEDSRA